MNSTATPQAPSLEAAQALARHLREHPEAASRSASELANDFGLQPEFVGEVIRGVTTTPREHRLPQTRFFKSIGTAFSNGFDGLTVKPVLFVSLLTAALCIAIGWDILASSSPHGHWHGPRRWWLSASMLVIILQMSCFYRHGQVRNALYGALTSWMILSITSVVVLWLTTTDKSADALLSALFVMSVASLMMATFYAALGSFFAVLGGYVRIRGEERAEELMTRQQLLERLFEVQSRLKTCHARERVEKNFIPASLVEQFNRQPYLTSIAGTLSLSILSIVLFHYAGVQFEPTESPTALVLLVDVAAVLATAVFMTTIAYLAGGFRRALAIALVSNLVATPTFLIPLAPFGPDSRSFLFATPQLVVKGLLILAFTSIGAIGSVVEERTLRVKRLQESDPAALLAEMVRLEWRLNAGTNNVCVVVVDAAKSAEMKANADPLVAEYSFREYQGFLANICKSNGGTVHSTAGDGAVLSFPHCDQAIAAAKEIQTGISYFNEHVNRMTSKFRLRVGIHQGPVTGDLKDVQFTEVIDIAAHVQAAAPVRGILMTKAVADCLPGEHIIPLKDPVDGCEVFLAYNPTVDD